MNVEEARTTIRQVIQEELRGCLSAARKDDSDRARRKVKAAIDRLENIAAQMRA